MTPLINNDPHPQPLPTRGRGGAMRAALLTWLGATPDDDVLRWLYRALLVATVAVLVLDYTDFQDVVAERSSPLSTTEQPSAQPLPARPKEGGRRPAPLRQTDARLR